MQLLKLVYIAHGWMLGLYGRPLIRDEIQAWKYGPVIPDLYAAIRHYRGNPVEDIPVSWTENQQLDELENDLITQVYDKYGHLSGPALSQLTHQKNSPWHAVYDSRGWADTIPNDLIRVHYAGLAEGAAQCGSS